MFVVYILRCSDGSYYVGMTQDLTQRVKAHDEGKAAAYTRCRRPVQLVYSEVLDSDVAALRRERQLKRWSRVKKEALIGGDLSRVRVLSRRRSR